MRNIAQGLGQEANIARLSDIYRACVQTFPIVHSLWYFNWLINIYGALFLVLYFPWAHYAFSRKYWTAWRFHLVWIHATSQANWETEHASQSEKLQYPCTSAILHTIALWNALPPSEQNFSVQPCILLHLTLWEVCSLIRWHSTASAICLEN